jgi:hypothetical protein
MFPGIQVFPEHPAAFVIVPKYRAARGLPALTRCAECYARWPCSAHLVELRWQADRVEDERATEAERW